MIETAESRQVTINQISSVSIQIFEGLTRDPDAREGSPRAGLWLTRCAWCSLGLVMAEAILGGAVP